MGKLMNVKCVSQKDNDRWSLKSDSFLDVILSVVGSCIAFFVTVFVFNINAVLAFLLGIACLGYRILRNGQRRIQSDLEALKNQRWEVTISGEDEVVK